jgi:hypothetical protein
MGTGWRFCVPAACSIGAEVEALRRASAKFEAASICLPLSSFRRVKVAASASRSAPARVRETLQRIGYAAGNDGETHARRVGGNVRPRTSLTETPLQREESVAKSESMYPKPMPLS